MPAQTCPKCSAAVDSETAKFCPACGASLGDASPAGAAEPQTKKPEEIPTLYGCLLIIILTLAGSYFLYKIYSPTPPSAAEVQEQKLLAEQEAKWGKKPVQSALTASVPEVVSYLEGILSDPDSLEFSGWGKLVYDGGLGWMVWADFRAKNAFGGYVREKTVFFIKDGQVYRTENFEAFRAAVEAFKGKTAAGR